MLMKSTAMLLIMVVMRLIIDVVVFSFVPLIFIIQPMYHIPVVHMKLQELIVHMLTSANSQGLS